MKKVGICGVYGLGPKFSGGQPVKTRMIVEELIRLYGEKEIEIANTHNWKNKPLKMLGSCFKLSQNCRNIIIMPAHNGIKIFTLVFLFFNIFYRRKIHYVVIGGWLPDYIKRIKFLRYGISKFSGVYVETNSMKSDLEYLGMKNVFIMNNFKKLPLMRLAELKFDYSEPHKLCYFSRIVKEKGVEDIIETIVKVNTILGREVYNLDLYGYIDEKYIMNFEKILIEVPEYIKYKGVINPDNSVQALRNYFLQLFPTHYRTEGIPGSIIDSYFAGVPILASKWNSFSDVIDEGKTGIGYEFSNCEDLKFKLLEIAARPQIIVGMKKNCVNKAVEYSSDYVMSEFAMYLE